MNRTPAELDSYGGAFAVRIALPPTPCACPDPDARPESSVASYDHDDATEPVVPISMSVELSTSPMLTDAA